MMERKGGSLSYSLSSLSLKDLKYQIGYENLKDNLNPFNKNTKKTLDSSKPKRTIQVKIIQNEKNIDKMLKKVVEMDEKNNQLNQILIEGSDKKKSVEKEVSSFNFLHESIILEKKKMKKHIESVNLKRKRIESKTLSISNYVNDLKYKNNHTKETIKSYEDEINTLKESISNLNQFYKNRYSGIGTYFFIYRC
jgi:chromosome segregation ATPase